MVRVIFFLLFVFLSVNAQSQIEGDIEGPNGKGIPEAVVTATDTSGKIVATVRSDSRGFYIFTSLQIGKYKIEVNASRFKDAVFENIRVRVEKSTDKKEGGDISAATRLDIVLEPLKST